MKFWSQFEHFHSRNTLEKVVCEIASILSRPQCVTHKEVWTMRIFHGLYLAHAYYNATIVAKGTSLIYSCYSKTIISMTWLDPDSKVCGANIGPTWGRQVPGGPNGGPMNLAIWVVQDCNTFSVLATELLALSHRYIFYRVFGITVL